MAGGVVGKLRYNATIAEVIISLMAGSGAGVTNTNYLNQLNQSYGINSTLANATGTDGTIGAMLDAGYFSIGDDGTFIDNGLLSAIEAQPAYTNCNVNDIFGTWNDSHTEIVTSAAENLGTSVSAAAAIGTLSQVAGAAILGYNLGNLGWNIAEKIGQKMATQTLITASQNVPVGTRALSGSITNSSTHATTNYLIYLPNNCFFATTDSILAGTPRKTIWGCNPTNSSIRMTHVLPGARNQSISAKRYGSTNLSDLRDYEFAQVGGSVSMNFSTQAELSDYLNSNPDPINFMPFSPDVIGKNGNQRPINYTDVNDPTNWPDIGQQTPEGKGITAIPMDDYMDWVEIANNNTTNNITNVEQGDIFNNFIENYYVTPEAIPDYTPIERPDYNPTVPEQPTPNTKPTNTPETNQSNTDYMTTPGLKDVFPFCIPWDIVALFTSFDTIEREAPVVSFPIKSNLFGIDEEVTIDLTPYDDIATLLRTLELIAFALGLAFVTRYLIGAGS